MGTKRRVRIMTKQGDITDLTNITLKKPTQHLNKYFFLVLHSLFLLYSQ